MGEYEPNDSRDITQTNAQNPIEPPRTGPMEDQARQSSQSQGGSSQSQGGAGQSMSGGQMNQSQQGYGSQRDDQGRSDAGQAQQDQPGDANQRGDGQQTSPGTMRSDAQPEQYQAPGQRDQQMTGSDNIAAQVREHMQVIGADGVPVGVVDGIEGDKIKLTKKSSSAGFEGEEHDGHHHFLPVGLIADVEGDTVRLSANGAVAYGMEEEGKS